MIVKIKNSDIWVTPGFYQDSVQFIKEGLIDIALTYGITVSPPQLKGIFSMRHDNEESNIILESVAVALLLMT